jgi:DNA-binding protein HU-beta
VNKSELTAAIAAKSGQSKAAVADVINAMTDVVPATVADGQEVTIPGFGKFEPVFKPAKSRYNAMLGRVVDTPAKTVPKFTPGAVFERVVNGDQQTIKAA